MADKKKTPVTAEVVILAGKNTPSGFKGVEGKTITVKESTARRFIREKIAERAPIQGKKPAETPAKSGK
jgi:hypothetical protein